MAGRCCLFCHRRFLLFQCRGRRSTKQALHALHAHHAHAAAHLGHSCAQLLAAARLWVSLLFLFFRLLLFLLLLISLLIFVLTGSYRLGGFGLSGMLCGVLCIFFFAIIVVAIMLHRVPDCGRHDNGNSSRGPSGHFIAIVLLQELIVLTFRCVASTGHVGVISILVIGATSVLGHLSARRVRHSRRV